MIAAPHSMFHPLAVALVAPLLLATPPALAQDSPASSAAPAPQVRAERRTGPIVLDGRLDEAAWTVAPPATDFRQQRPEEGAPASERTEVRFLYDDDALYIGARMFDSAGPAGVVSRLVRRDGSPESDLLRIDVDPYHDRLRSFEFDVNPAGWRGDAAGDDRSWDPVWEAEARVDSLGWTAEIRIPFSQLRFGRDSVQTWGLNLTRIIQRKQERALWSFWRQNEPGGPAYFGDLTGLRIGGRTQRAELLPYVVARTQRLSSGEPASPFHEPSPSDVRVGGDARLLLGSSFTLSATVNPDFGQVEVDPAVVNLGVFETFFPERRPFFVEGAELFEFGMPGCNINCGFGLFSFYSRRIGRAPQGAALAYEAGEYADVPENTDILGAVKVTGRTPGGTTVGVLDAVTSREVAEVVTEDGRFLTQPVEPLTNNFVARVRHEMRGGRLMVGGLLTSVDRKLDDPALGSLLPSSARTGGVDAEFSWDRRTWVAYAALALSQVSGEADAILRLQRASARYFQRPDRTLGDGLFSRAYDPSATELTGYGAIARIRKQGGNWIGDLNAAVNSPGFDLNELGFLARADWRWINGTIGRQFTTPTRFYRRMTVMAGAEQQWNFDGDVTGRDVSLVTSGELPNYWNVHLFLLRYFPSYSDRLTRGGPVVRQPGATMASFGLSTDGRRPLVLGTGINASVDDDEGYSVSGSLTATVRPSSRIVLTAGPGYVRSRSTDQFVTSVADETATAFYGRRYVFAHLEQRQLYMTARASVTFTPRLSLDVFAQPLLFGADYHSFLEFAAPRTLRKRIYGRDMGVVETEETPDGVRYVIDPDAAGPAEPFTLGNPDFNLRSLRGTAVLRWEWRPGSTAYLVWTQTRSGVAPFGDLDFGRDRRALLDTPADNIFLLKFSYWLGL